MWVTSCLDLCLAAQADTLDESKKKLEAMICEYVYDAVAGEDKAYAGQLLTRKAPVLEWAKYYVLVARYRLGGVKDGIYQLFTESLPLVPCK